MSVEGKPVPQDELSTIVRKIVPEDTSRFFLFDGEILQEYQNLLDIDSKTSKRISQAIEDVLGVPALTQLTRELPGAIKRLRTKTQAELQKQQASDTFTQELNTKTEILDAKQSELTRLNETIAKDKLELENLETLLRENEKNERLLQDRSELNHRIDGVQRRVEELQQEKKTNTESLWGAILDNR